MKTHIISEKEFSTELPVKYLEARYCDVKRWQLKGLLSIRKDRAMIKSKDLMRDVREEPGLISYVLDMFWMQHDMRKLDLRDLYKDQLWKKQLREEGRDVEIADMERKGQFLRDHQLASEIERHVAILQRQQAVIEELYLIRHEYEQEQAKPIAA
jgi:hypothetical protein